MDKESIMLKVGGATDPASFAGAIYKNYQEGKTVSARALGASANFQMCKGISIAEQFFASHGMRLYTQIESRMEKFDKGDEIRSFTASFFVLPEADQLAN